MEYTISDKLMSYMLCQLQHYIKQHSRFLRKIILLMTFLTQLFQLNYGRLVRQGNWFVLNFFTLFNTVQSSFELTQCFVSWESNDTHISDSHNAYQSYGNTTEVTLHFTCHVTWRTELSLGDVHIKTVCSCLSNITCLTMY